MGLIALAVPYRLAEKAKAKMTGAVVIPLPEGGRPHPQDVARAEGAERIVLLGPDPDGLLGYARWLDLPRCWAGLWSGRPEELESALLAAKPVPIPHVCLAGEVLERLELEMLQGVSPAEQGLPTGVSGLDGVFGGLLVPGNMVGLMGYAKTGKTSLALQIAAHNVARGLAALYVCLEMSEKALSLKTVSQITGRAEINAQDIRAARMMLEKAGGILAIGSGGASVTVDQVCSMIQAVHRRYGLDLVVLDNLHILVRSDERSVEAVGVASKKIRALTSRLPFPVLLILQPRRPDRHSDGPPAFGDVLWSSAVECDVDALVVVHRWRREDGTREPEMLVRLELSRYSGERQTVVVFDGGTGRVRDADEDERAAFFRRRKWEIPSLC